MQRRVISVWCCRLSVDHLARRRGIAPTLPFAAVAEEKNALRLHRVNEGAAARGLASGMALTDAKAVVPDLLTGVREVEREGALLRALHRFVYRYSPYGAIDGEDGILLDITGCAHLFGGEEAMGRDLLAYLDAHGIAVRLAIADTKGAARALARFGGQDFAIVPPGRTRTALAPLPVAALGPQSIELRRLGLQTLGEVAQLPRPELTRRFGVGLSLALDEALGVRASPVSPVAPERIFAARMSFPEPIGHLEDVTEALARVLDVLCRRLQKAGRGARGVEMILTGADGREERRQVGMARPCHEPAPILRQLTPFLDKIDMGFGLDRVRVVVLAHEAHAPRQRGTEEAGTPPRDEALTDLVGRLGNRLGFDRVTCLRPEASHLPGFDLKTPQAVAAPGPADWPRRTGPQPLRLCRPAPLTPLAPGRPPGRFSWRGRTFAVARAEGPKRLAGEWWQEEEDRLVTRDYWQVETEEGPRLWLVCDAAPGEGRGWTVAGALP